MGSISLKKINKIYPDGAHAVHDLSLDIDDGVFTVLVGPSGCGKSTLLRMIAGLEEITFGELYIDGQLANELAPKDRGIAMVFQNYALFPHMTVFDNIAFGLKMAKVGREEIKARVEEAAATLEISNLLSRKPAQLSGGQKQRVALGRAIVSRPRIFLLDEPLSNLDAKLRASMRGALIKLHRKLGITFIYVTHDQTEALTMGDRIAVLKDGVLQQASSPVQIYNEPENLFVATFIGSPQINIFEATLGSDGGLTANIGDAAIELPECVAKRLVSDGYIGKSVTLGIRPEHIKVTDGDAAEVTGYELLGSNSIISARYAGFDIKIVTDGDKPFETGSRIGIQFAAEHVRLFDKDTGASLLSAPDYNRIAAKIELKDGKLAVTTPDFAFISDAYDRIRDESVFESAKLAFLPDICKDGDIKLGVTVDYVCRTDDYTLVYAKTRKSGERVIFRCENGGGYVAGKSCEIALSSENIIICNADGERAETKYPSRGRERKLHTRGSGKKCENLRILADERYGAGWLLYCGSEENYCVVEVPKDFPVYKNTELKVDVEETAGA